MLLVLISHYFPAPVRGEHATFVAYAHRALYLSYTGVDLFFVISGFLIGGILLDHRTSPTLLRTFYVRRALRILPLAFLFIVTVWILWHAGAFPAADLSLAPEPFPWWAYFGFVPNLFMAAHLDWGFRPLAGLWSLGVEEQFYLVVPWLLLAVRRPILVALGFIAVGLWSRVVLLFFWPQLAFAAHHLPFCRADTLGVGLLAACLVRSPAALAALRRRRLVCWLGFGVAAGFFALLTGGYGYVRPGHLPLASFGYATIAALYGLALLLIATTENRHVQALWSHPVLVSFGRCSYFIYLFQGLFALALGRALLAAGVAPLVYTRYLQLFLVPLGTLGLAALSARWLERPLLRLGHRLHY